MARGDLYDGWFVLAGDFPPSVNTDDDDTRLKPFESPSCYGVDITRDGQLKTGSIPPGTARSAPTKTVSAVVYSWYYKRLWLAATNTLSYYAPEYDDAVFPQDLGKFTFDANIVTFMPAFQSDMWVVTGAGSSLLKASNDPRAFFEPTRLAQEMDVAAANRAITLDGIPYVSNATGVFSWDGNGTKEWTRPVRGSLGSFGAVAILADYEKKYIIGTSNFAIDTSNGKLFDYGTSGFLFTSRTLAQPAQYSPFQVGGVAFVIERANTTDGTIKWQTKFEDNDWFDEDDIRILDDKTRVQRNLENKITAARKFAVRVTTLSSNIYIREIQVVVSGLAQEAFTE